MADGKYVHRHYRNHHDSRNAGTQHTHTYTQCTHPTTTSHTARVIFKKRINLGISFEFCFVLLCCVHFQVATKKFEHFGVWSDTVDDGWKEMLNI